MNDQAQASTSNVSAAPAIFLWVVVGSGLVYGVYQTLTAVPALFGA
jgi:hypothetical protein